VCKSEGGDKSYYTAPQNLRLEPQDTKEILLDVIPKQAGDLEITQVEWELFEVVRCSRSLKGLSGITSMKKSAEEMALKFKVIETSGECETHLVLAG